MAFGNRELYPNRASRAPCRYRVLARNVSAATHARMSPCYESIYRRRPRCAFMA